MLDYDSFKKVFPSRLIRKLKSPIVPYAEEIDRTKVLEELYREIISYTYHPSLCHEHLVFNKNNGVIRISPIFKPKDSILYYFCTKMIEDEIAENRVEGTYGGWRIGNKIRFVEEEEEGLILTDYVFNDSYNPFLWFSNWKNFQKKAFIYSQGENCNYIVKLDIANFYDNINLHLLEKKLYMVVGNKKRAYVELLLYFLRNWNKTIAGFSEKHVGLPQESIADCSRLLANFYLQDYDIFMKELCDRGKAKYLRYADDQIIYADSKEKADYILFKASKFLLNQGLNFNANKAEVFKDINLYNQYWAFDIFELLDNTEDKNKINEGIRLFLERIQKDIKFRKDSVLKRILSIDFNKIEPEHRHRIFSLIYDKDFLSRTDYWTLNKMYQNIEESKKQEFLIILDDLINTIIYNSYHYNLVKFYELNKIPYDKQKIRTRIEKLKI